MAHQTYHLIGIGGIGMSGLARIALQKGCKVSGSDVKNSPILEALGAEGAQIFIGHDESHVENGAIVIYSTDISPENPEMRAAKAKGLTMWHRSEFLKELMRDFFPLLVTGTHGKTTTSSLLAHVLISSGQDPAYSIGGIVQSVQSNGGFGRGKWFAAEADESDRSFLIYEPYGAIVTNIGLDHLNHWHSEENLIRGFREFCQKVRNPDLLFWCRDDRRLSSLSLKGHSYGFSSSADLKIEDPVYGGWKSTFSFSWKGKRIERVEIPMIGAHSVLNAAAVFGLCLCLGIEEGKIREALKSFSGVKRRVEKKGEARGISFYDDYGHHPTEIAATLQAVKTASEDQRVVVAFQPHRFTRTRDCFHEFAPALGKADLVVLTDVYSAGEPKIEGVSSEALLETFQEEEKEKAVYIPKEDLLEKLLALLKPGDVVVSMGAGDITNLGPELLKRIHE